MSTRADGGPLDDSPAGGAEPMAHERTTGGGAPSPHAAAGVLLQRGVLTPPLHASVSRYTVAALAAAKHQEELAPAAALQHVEHAPLGEGTARQHGLLGG